MKPVSNDMQREREEDLRAFDSLPEEIREALRSCDLHLKATQVKLLLENYNPGMIRPDLRNDPSVVKLVAAIEQVRARKQRERL